MKCKYCEHCKLEEMIQKIADKKVSRETIGQKIKYYRLKSGISQMNLAKILGYESATAVSLIEAGDRKVDAETLWKIASVFDIGIREFFN